LVGLPVYFFTRGAIGNSAAVLLMIGLMMPFFFFAMYERDGQPAEKILKNRLRYKLWPKDRPYRTDNLYKSMSKKEVTKIAKKQAAGSSGKASAKKYQAGQKDQSRCKAGQN
ncbi:PrgI family protein, partial [Waltera sp.]